MFSEVVVFDFIMYFMVQQTCHTWHNLWHHGSLNIMSDHTYDVMVHWTRHTWPTGDVNGPQMDLYKNFPLVVSERWQQEVTENVFDMINQEMDEIEQKRKHSPQLVISQTTMKSPQSLTPYTLTLHRMNSPVINPSHPGELTTIIIMQKRRGYVLFRKIK